MNQYIHLITALMQTQARAGLVKVAIPLSSITMPNLRSTPTPKLHGTPTSLPQVNAPSASVGPDLTIILLLLVTFLLLAVICGVIWMFLTKRWQVAARPSQGPLNSSPAYFSQGPRNSNPAYSTAPFPSQPILPPLSARPLAANQPQAQPQVANVSLTQPRAEDPLKNTRWVKLAQECADLFDELDNLFPASDPRQEAADHVQDRLQEILKRSGVEIISLDQAYDDHRHRLEKPAPNIAPGAPIAKIVSPGFAIGRLVLRPARVRVASSRSEDSERHS